MKWMRVLGLGEMSPLGALVAGALIGAAGMPVVKKGIRGVAVSTVGAALAASDFIKNMGGCANREWRNMVEDARLKRAERGDGVKENLREAGLGLACAGLSVADMARERYQDIKDNIGEKFAQVRETTKEAAENLTDSIAPAEEKKPDNDNADM